ncbi:hypothetical protein [Nocardia terpenica]|nr:hypothetical protein [Nocardia terpenica]
MGGHPGVVPALTGRAWVTRIGAYLLDPTPMSCCRQTRGWP